MATLQVRLIKGTHWRDMKTIKTICVVGKKMTKKWITDHYGKDSSVVEMYQCHKNPYGITWVSGWKSRWGDIHFDICTDPLKVTEALPYYDTISYSRL